MSWEDFLSMSFESTAGDGLARISAKSMNCAQFTFFCLTATHFPERMKATRLGSCFESEVGKVPEIQTRPLYPDGKVTAIIAILF